jgi:hypothetical protein
LFDYQLVCPIAPLTCQSGENGGKLLFLRRRSHLKPAPYPGLTLRNLADRAGGGEFRRALERRAL